jgi:hypothetical protein
MGTSLGNLLALVAITISVATGFYSLLAGAIVHSTVSYLAWAVLWASAAATRPPRDLPLCRLLTPAEINAYRAYHTYLIAPGAAQAFSNLLNGLRLAGLVWATVSLWHGFLWVAIALVAYFFVVSGLVVRLAPDHYMPPQASKGNHTAIEQLALIKAVRDKRESYNAAGRPVLQTGPDRRQARSSSRNVSEDSDWLFVQLTHAGEMFLRHAQLDSLIRQQPTPILAMAIRPDVEALLLGYKLVITAYRLDQGDSDIDVLRVLRTAMTGVFLKTSKENFQQVAHDIATDTGQAIDDSVPLAVKMASLELARTRLSAADSAIAIAVERVRTHSSSPLSSFYADLIAAFGGPGTTEEYERRYGPILQELFAMLQKAMQEHLDQGRLTPHAADGARM